MERFSGNEYACYCTNGHRNTFRGRLTPANCRQCNAAIDMIRGVVSISDEDDSAEMAAFDNDQRCYRSPLSTQNYVQTEERQIREGPKRISVAQRQSLPSSRSMQPPKVSRVAASDSITSRELQSSQIDSTSVSKPATKWKFHMDFFGEKIEIPNEGGWIGRSGIGSEWLQGNLLISRKHLYIEPLEDGSVRIGPEESLNGVYYDAGEGRIPLIRPDSVVIPNGSTIWLYNIPLKLECVAE